MKSAERKIPSLRLLGVSTAVLLLPSCNTLQTSSEPVNQPGRGKAHVGQYYFLPKAIIQITGTQEMVKDKDDNVYVSPYSITIKRLIVPDRKHRYFVRWTQNALYDDKLEDLSVDEQGLLTTVKFNTTDQTPGVIKDLAETTVGVFRIMGGGGAAALGKGTGGPPPFSYTFDPLDSAEVEAVRARLASQNGIVLLIDAGRGALRSGIGRALTRYQSTAHQAASGSADSPENGGVFYHPPTTVELRLHFTDYKNAVVQRTAIMVPDPDALATFRFGRSPLAKRSTQLTLVSGMPAKAFVERPSPVHALTTMTREVAGIVADAVPTIINVKDNRTRAQLANDKALIDAQTGTLKSQKALYDAQAAEIAARPVIESRKAGMPAIGGPGAGTKGEMAEKAEFLKYDESLEGAQKVKQIGEAFVREANANADEAEAKAAKARAEAGKAAKP